MREYKFRVWDKEDKRMITHEQEFIPLKITNIGVFRLDPGIEEDRWELKDSNRFEIMECSGLKDKKKNEIYENDIVLLDILNIQKQEGIDDTRKKELYKKDLNIISFKNGSFGFYPVFPELNCEEDRIWRPLLHEDGVWSKDMDVVGNIYKNPELLTQ